MKCYHIVDGGERVLIPGCYGAAEAGTIDCCVCPTYEPFEQFERKRYNEVVKELRERSKVFEAEYKKLLKTNERLSKQLRRKLTKV